MKASELRIGNIVKINNTTVEFTKMDFNLNEDFINPIPLTEDWLLKMGFRKQDNEDEVPYYFTNQPLNVTHNRFNGLYLSNGFRLLGKGLEIKHVHQLQNLYLALTGEELTVK